MKTNRSILAAGVLLAATLVPVTASADSGFYLGGSVGSATVEVDLGDIQLPVINNFDESDIGYKIFGGYNWQLSAVSLGIEGAYNNFGKPSADINDALLQIEPTGLSVFAIAAIGLGPVDLFGKAGMLAWDADSIEDGSISADDGSDPGYGVGLRFNAGSFEIRGEYEVYDIDEADLSVLSVGFAYRL